MKAIGYARVSTEEQAREGVSLDAQRAKIEAYAMLHDMELAEIVTDAGISGKAIANRPGAQKVIAAARSGSVDAVIVLKLDRLSRSVADVLRLVEGVFSNGTALHSISERLDTHSAAGRFVVTVLAALSQMEREQIGERTALALAYKRERGEAYGETPYGKRRDGDRLVDDPAAALGLAIMQDLRTQGMTYRQIAAELDRLGHRTRKGRPWSASTVHQVLRRVTADGAAVSVTVP